MRHVRWSTLVAMNKVVVVFPLVVAMALAGLGSGCRRAPTDAERARAERAKMRERLDRSYVLVPYRGLKTVVRAGGIANAPPEIAGLRDAVDATRAPDAGAESLLRLAKALHQARAALNAHDEDNYPPILAVVYPGALPLPWDAGVEHLALATLFESASAAAHKAPIDDLVLYELSRVEAKESWPWGLRLAAAGERGIAFARAEYHYAAEEELTALIAEIDRTPAAERPAIARAFRCTEAQSVEALRGAAHLLRAWNRMDLGRQQAADEDVEAALAALRRAGIENEATWWAGAYVAWRHGKYGEAAAELRKLAASPHLDEAERREITAAADGLERTRNAVVFGRARAGLLLGRALIARSGGVERLLGEALGPERTRAFTERVAWVERTASKLGDLDPRKLEDAARDVADKGRKGLEAIKSKLGQ